MLATFSIAVIKHQDRRNLQINKATYSFIRTSGSRGMLIMVGKLGASCRRASASRNPRAHVLNCKHEIQCAELEMVEVFKL